MVLPEKIASTSIGGTCIFPIGRVGIIELSVATNSINFIPFVVRLISILYLDRVNSCKCSHFSHTSTHLPIYLSFLGLINTPPSSRFDDVHRETCIPTATKDRKGRPLLESLGVLRDFPFTKLPGNTLSFQCYPQVVSWLTLPQTKSLHLSRDHIPSGNPAVR